MLVRFSHAILLSLLLAGPLSTRFAIPAEPIEQQTVKSAGLPAATTAGTPEDIEQRLSRLEVDSRESRQREALERGGVLYARACAACHGRGGRGDGPGAADLHPSPRNFTSGELRFRTTPSGAMPRPEDIERTIRRGLPGTAMPGFGELFSSDELAALSAYVSSLAPAALRSEALPAPIGLPPVPAADPASVSEGRAMFLLLECWNCHGLDVSGRGVSAEGMTDDSGRPIRPTDFRYAPLKGGRRPEDIVRTLLTGLNGTPMPSYGDTMVFAREDLGDTSSFAGRLPASAVQELEAFIRSSPTRSQVEALGEGGRKDLRDHRLSAIAHYILSLDRRRGFWHWLFRQRPEREARLP